MDVIHFPEDARPAAWVRGRASMTDTYNLGDRFDPGRPDLVDLLPLGDSRDDSLALAAANQLRR